MQQKFRKWKWLQTYTRLAFQAEKSRSRFFIVNYIPDSKLWTLWQTPFGNNNCYIWLTFNRVENLIFRPTRTWRLDWGVLFNNHRWHWTCVNTTWHFQHGFLHFHLMVTTFFFMAQISLGLSRMLNTLALFFPNNISILL